MKPSNATRRQQILEYLRRLNDWAPPQQIRVALQIPKGTMADLITYLHHGGLIEGHATRRGHYRITARGEEMFCDPS